ncbi:YadA-like family protein [Mannheimia glucosida]|uniref:YadA-like family protein n=1 Tax=Mannheimia glucosida TaxID=85401 RepID=UPI0039183FEB
MNRIFKITELSNNKGKISTSLFIMLIGVSGLADASPVSIQGSAISENAVSIGSNGYATAVDGIATGQGSVATGGGFSRENFASKVAENKAAIDIVNTKQNELNNVNNQLDATKDAIDSLSKQIDDLTKQQDSIKDKISIKEELENHKNSMDKNLNDKENELNIAKAALENILINGDNLFLDFTPLLQSLSWDKYSHLNGEALVIDELKSIITERFPYFSFSDEKYKEVVKGYVNKNATYNGAINSLINELSPVVNSSPGKNKVDYLNTALKDFYSNKTSLNQDGYISDMSEFIRDDKGSLYEGYSGYFFNDTNSFELRNKRYNDHVSVKSKVVIGSLYENWAMEEYHRKLGNENFQKLLNTLVLASVSQSENDKSLISGITQGFSPASGDRIGTGENDIFGTQVIAFNLRSLSGDKIPVFNIDYNSMYLDLLNSIDNDASDVLNSQDIANFNKYRNALLDFYNNVNWNDKESPYNLIAYKERMDKVIEFNDKLNDYNMLYLKEDKTNNDISTLMKLLKEIKELGNNDEYRLGSFRLELTEYAYKELNYSKDKVDAIISRINEELKLYEPNNEIVVKTKEKAKELQEAYDNAKKSIDDTQKEIDALSKEIENLALTEDEKAIDNKKLGKQVELDEIKNKKLELEQQLKDRESELNRAKDELAKTSLKDLGLHSQAYGSNAFSSGNDSISIGTNAIVTSTDGISIGRDSAVIGNQSIAVGADSSVTGNSSIVIGVEHTVSGARSGTLGTMNMVNADDAYALGNNNILNHGASNTFVLGSNIITDVANSVALGANTVLPKTVGTPSIEVKGKIYNFAGADPVGTVSVGAEDVERTITNVAAGRISDISTDAINGSQLFAVINAIDNLKMSESNSITTIQTIKGGTGVTVTIDTDKVQTVNVVGVTTTTDEGKSHTRSDLTKSVGVKGDRKNIRTTTAANGDVRVSMSDNIQVNSVSIHNGPNITQNGINANNTRVTNVQDGISPTDAVNVRQLNQQGNVLNQRIDNLANNVKKNKKRADAGIAATAAMSNIPQVMLAGKSGVGVGVGNHSGQTAVAVGYSRASDNAKHIIKLSAGVDTQSKATFGAGYMYQW